MLVKNLYLNQQNLSTKWVLNLIFPPPLIDNVPMKAKGMIFYSPLDRFLD